MVKAGYKQTEVGVIPEDWDVEELQAIASLERGKFTARPRNDPKFFGGDIPFIQTGDVTGASGWITTYSQTLNKEGLKVSKLFPKDTLFFTIAANIGDVAFSTFDTACPDSLVAITAKLVNKRWLAYELSSRKSIFESLATQNAQLNINLEKLRPYQIPMPPTKAEQQAIAGALSDVDGLIGSVEKLIAKKRSIKTGTMQQLLTGKQRLPGFSGEWGLKKISEFTDGTSGGTPSTTISAYWGGDIRWMSSGELHLKFVADVEARITEEGLQNSSTKPIPPNCVLIGLAGQGKTRGTVAINMVELCTNQSIAAIYPNDSFCPLYLYYNLDNRYEELRGLSTGDGGRGGLNLTILRNIEIPFPNPDEQQAIATVLSDMDAEIQTLETKLAKTKAIKQGMMSELLTGKTRLVAHSN